MLSTHRHPPLDLRDGPPLRPPARRADALGKPLAPLDLMIAAHALAEGATLVTADRAFAQVPGLALQDYEHA